jgi:hypothetical protein
MLEKRKHLKEIINTKTSQIHARDKIIDEQKIEIHKWQKENKELRYENEEFLELVKKIRTISESNHYNNAEIALKRINELVCDYQSRN